MDVRCVLVKLKLDSVERVRDWAAMIASRKEEALATLRDEGVTIESAFLMRREDGDYLIYYMRAVDMVRAREVSAVSTHEIDLLHKAFKAEVWERVEVLECLVDLTVDG